MSVVTTMTEDGRFKVTRSDAGYYIRKSRTNEVYAEAWDVPESTFKYVETKDKIDNAADSDEQSDQPAVGTVGDR